MLEPNMDDKQGVITSLDSLNAPSVLALVERIMPLFARLVNARPGLDWSQEGWSVRTGRTTIQDNDHDCGPITGDNCNRLLQRLELTIVDSGRKAAHHGSDLRYEYLERLYPLFMDEPLKSA